MQRARLRLRSAVLLPLALLLLLLVGCVSVNSTMVDPSATFAPVPSDQVRLFESEDEVPTDYRRVAIFHAEGADNWTDQKVANALLGTGADREGRAVGIRWGDLNEEDESADPGDESSQSPRAEPGDDASELPHYHISVN